MRKRLLSFAVVLVAVTALATPAIAGGWASVRLDGPAPPAFQEVPWTIDFMVKQHDVSPINVEQAFLSATHRESGETVSADAVQEGEVGHYTVTVIFPLAGDWRWSITPAPFAESTFPTLHVLAGPGEAASSSSTAAQATSEPHPAHIHSGTCASLGDVVYPLTDVGGGGGPDATPMAGAGFVGAQSAVPVEVSETTIEAGLDSLLDGNHAINVHESAANIGNYIACGDIGGVKSGDELAIGLQPLNDSGMAGVAVLTGTGTTTTVTVYLSAVGGQAATASASAATAEVKLTNSAVFVPSRLEIKVGTTVTWTNESSVAHTVTGSSFDFENSGYIDPGQTFSQTFTKPGVYAYKCDPHPGMTGTIVVT
jgi:plastocyanin